MFTKNTAVCHYQELPVNKRGYVVRCRECHHFQLYFKGVVFSSAAGGFEQLLQLPKDVAERDKKAQPDVDYGYTIPAGTIIELIGQVQGIGKTSLQVPVNVCIDKLPTEFCENAIGRVFLLATIDEKSGR